MAAAGEVALRHFCARGAHWFKAPGQIVTAADLEIDRLLYESLIGEFPDDAWLSEERADDRARLHRARVWMVDPIDGTRAFANGLPEFAISVARSSSRRTSINLRPASSRAADGSRPRPTPGTVCS